MKDISPPPSQLALLETMGQGEFEQIAFWNDSKAGLKSMVAIHSTRLGPALGGCRFFNYKNEASALFDVMNLARAMTYKSALAGIRVGGGKAVVIGDPQKDKSEKLWKSFGQFLERLGGSYLTTEDSGTSTQDMDLISPHTRYVTGQSPENGGAGDPSPITALGVAEGIRAAVEVIDGAGDLSGKVVAIQGVGHVGLPLAQQLRDLGATLVVADVNRAAVDEAISKTGATAVSPEEIFGVEADVFSPCALGGAINPKTLNQLRCRIIAGGANNQLGTEEMGEALAKRKITYIPDFAANPGGVIHVAQSVLGYDQNEVERLTRKVYDTVKEILHRSATEGLRPEQVARNLAEERLAAG